MEHDACPPDAMLRSCDASRISTIRSTECPSNSTYQGVCSSVRPAGCPPKRFYPGDPFQVEPSGFNIRGDRGSFPHKEATGWKPRSLKPGDQHLRFNPILHQVSLYVRREGGNVERCNEIRTPRNEKELRAMSVPKNVGKRKGMNEFHDAADPKAMNWNRAHQSKIASDPRAFHRRRGLCSEVCEVAAKHPENAQVFEATKMRPKVERVWVESAERAPAAARTPRPHSAVVVQQRPQSARSRGQGASSAAPPRTPRAAASSRPAYARPTRPMSARAAAG